MLIHPMMSMAIAHDKHSDLMREVRPRAGESRAASRHRGDASATQHRAEPAS